MSLYRFFRACLVALLSCLALQAHAQPLDTLALRAKADSLNQAGAEHYANGDPVAAVTAFQEAIQIRETLLQERNAALVSSYNGLGINLLFMGDYESAIVPISRAKDLAREFLGEQHPLYANCLNNIGLCYLRFCDYNKALDYITQKRPQRMYWLGVRIPVPLVLLRLKAPQALMRERSKRSSHPKPLS